LLAKNLQARVELLRVVEHLPPEWMDWVIGRQPLEIAARMSRHAEDYLEGVAASLAADALRAYPIIRGGADAATIVEEAEKEPDTLLVMCTHGRTGITRWILGSVMDKVLQAASCPLLIVPAREEEKVEPVLDLRTVIVPLDGSSLAEQVIPHAAALAQALNLRVILVRVTLPVEDYYRAMEYPVAPYGDPSREIDTMAQNYFSQVREKLQQQGIAKVEVKILHGHPADAIIVFAQETPHNLVAMTTHGRSGIGRWALGSVTDRVVRYCGDPTLVVRAEE
jgi:nucleotide-binding universal stress UspA family protein